MLFRVPRLESWHIPDSSGWLAHALGSMSWAQVGESLPLTRELWIEFQLQVLVLLWTFMELITGWELSASFCPIDSNREKNRSECLAQLGCLPFTLECLT